MRVRPLAAVAAATALALTLFAYAAAPGRGSTLVVGIKAEPDSLNPYLARQAEALVIANRVLPRLWREVLPGDAVPAGLVPELAAGNAAFGDGGKTARITLRKGLSWSDGAPLACADVRATYAAQIDPALGWRASSVKRHIVSVACENETTLVVRFDRAYPGALVDVNDVHVLPAALAAKPRSEWRQLDWAKLLPSAGPFRIARVAPAQEIVLERNPRWGGTAARLERIVFRVVPDTALRLTQLAAGDLDLVDDVAPDKAVALARDPALKIVRRPGWGYTYLGWNVVDPSSYGNLVARSAEACRSKGGSDCPLDAKDVAAHAKGHPHPLLGDARVRRALTLAIDRTALVDTLLAGQGDIPSSPILAPLPEHDSGLAPLPLDAKRARTLLAEAGFGDADRDGTLDRKGKPFSITIAVAAGNRQRRDAAVMIQRDLARVGVAVAIRPVEDSSFYAVLAARETDAWIGSWRVPARVDMTENLHADGCGTGGSNFGAWSHPEADRLALAARDEVDPKRRAEQWHRWEKFFADEQPYTILFRQPRLTVVNTRVRGVESLLANDPLEGVEGWIAH